MLLRRPPIQSRRKPRGVAQLVAHRSPKPGVAGSSPVAPVLGFTPKPRSDTGFRACSPVASCPLGTAEIRPIQVATGAQLARRTRPIDLGVAVTHEPSSRQERAADRRGGKTHDVRGDARAAGIATGSRERRLFAVLRCCLAQLDGRKLLHDSSVRRARETQQYLLDARFQRSGAARFSTTNASARTACSRPSFRRTSSPMHSVVLVVERSA